jgi:transcriptional regulator with XRE-family HTH domain
MSESEVCLKFASFVKSKRLEKKIGIREIRERSGLSRAFIHVVETGKCSPSLDSATRLLRGINESWDSFIESIGKHDKN